MQVIIVGCGKVGSTIARELQEDEADINLTLIDVREHKVEDLADELDAMTIVGNGASINVLMEAGIEWADLLIAVTNSDELNLLCCVIAQKTSRCNTIARVRNPMYGDEIAFLKERLGVTMIINPELAAAQEISRLHRLPTAIKIDTFARGRVELLKFRIQPEFGLDGMSILELAEKFRIDILVCGIENKDGIIIPGGNDIIHEGDMISILSTPENTARLFKRIGLKAGQIRSSIIIGGGTTSYYVAKMLLAANIQVKLIEKDGARCEELSDLLPEATIIHGDGTDRKLLMEEGMKNAGSMVFLTNLDEENIFLSLYCRSQTKAKLISKVNRLEFDDVLDDLDLDSVIYPKYITADRILSYVRAMENSIGSNVETLYHIMEGQAEALEFIVRDHCAVVGIPLAQLKLKPNLLVGCLNRNGQVRIPRGQDSMQVGDTVVIVTTQKGLRDLDDILA